MRNLAPVNESADIVRRQDLPWANVMDYGAVGNGSTNDAAAFAAAIADRKIAYAPPGSYQLDTPIELANNGEGIIGAGIGATTFICTGGFVKRNTSAGIVNNALFQGFTVQPKTKTSHANSQLYLNATAFDLTGFSYSVLRDINVVEFQTGLNFGYNASYATYFNRVESVYVLGGATCVLLDGSSSDHDGANGNSFVACVFRDMGMAVLIRGCTNNFIGTKIENPMQTSGYPLTSIGFQIESGYYAIGNSITDTYLELVGTGNQGIKFTGAGTWISNNVFSGGYYNVNGTYETPYFETASALYSQSFNCPNLTPSSLLLHDAAGGNRQIHIASSGEMTITNSSGTVLTTLPAGTAVAGPTSSVGDGHVAVFDGTTGKVLKDGGAVGNGSGDVVGPASSTTDHVVVFADATGKLLKDGGVTKVVKSFTTSMTQANFVTMVADMTIDIIEMQGGTYQDWHYCILNVDRSTRPLLIRPAPGAAVVWDGTTDESTDGVFYFGMTALAAYITFDATGTGGSFTIQNYTICQTGLVYTNRVSHLTMNGFRCVGNKASTANGSTRWAVYIASDGSHRSNDIVMEDWVSVSGDAYMNHLQVQGSYNVDRATFRRWRTSGGNYGAFLAGDATAVVLDDWVMFGHTYVGIEVNGAAVTLRDCASDATCKENIYDTSVTDGGGNHFVSTTLKLAKSNSGAYINITCGDVTTTFDGNDTDGWMDFVFKSNGVEKATLSGSDGDLSIDGSLTEGVPSLVKLAGDTMTGPIIAADHGTAATDQVVNVCYGTGDPPTANTTTEGTLFIKYTA